MTDFTQRQAAQKFVQKWLPRKGSKKGEYQAFWLELLHDVLGVPFVSDFINFAVPVTFWQSRTRYIDAVIPSTRVLIEHKSSHVDLDITSLQVGRSDRANGADSANGADGIDDADGSNGSKGAKSSKLSPLEHIQCCNAMLAVEQQAHYFVLCNFSKFVIVDCQHHEQTAVEIKLEDLAQECYRLRFLVESDNAIWQQRKHLNTLADTMLTGQQVAVFYRELLQQYIDPQSPESIRSLNKLCVRLIFCFYAEDAGWFATRHSCNDYLKDDPKYVRDDLMRLFAVLNTKIEERDPYINPDLQAFPYISGDLFREEKLEIPRFTSALVDLLLNEINLGFKWRELCPSQFAVLFAGTLDPETRRPWGVHYTAIEDIHKVIDPLFLDDLKSEFQDICKVISQVSRARQLASFQHKLASIKIFAPACGAGDFLTEAYLSLRRLENDVIRARLACASLGAEAANPILISSDHFYGLDSNDFAVTVARTALCIVENQILQETCDIVGHDIDFLPLRSYSNIVEAKAEANAVTPSWKQIFGTDAANDELTYIVGEPPFSRARE